jgi:hypothetical protein
VSVFIVNERTGFVGQAPTLANMIADVDGSYLDEARQTGEILVSGLMKLRKLFREEPEWSPARELYASAQMAYRAGIVEQYNQDVLTAVWSECVIRTNPNS